MNLAIKIVVFVLYMLTGCCSNSNPEFFVQGVAIVEADTLGKLKLLSKKTSYRETIHLRNVGDTAIFDIKTPIKISIEEGIDLGNHALKTELIDMSTPKGSKKMVRAEVASACKVSIYLEDKCQTVRWYNPWVLPEVKLMSKKANALEQVVCTPMLNSSCELIGYEIRYGSEEHGCTNEKNSISVLNQYKKCYSGGPLIPRPPTNVKNGGKPVDLTDLFSTENKTDNK